jgi:hypothetical protein
MRLATRVLSLFFFTLHGGRLQVSSSEEGTSGSVFGRERSKVDVQHFFLPFHCFDLALELFDLVVYLLPTLQGVVFD